MLQVAMRSVLASGRIPGRAGRAAHAALSGVWLGVLDEDQLRELDELYYRQDPIYSSADWNARGLSPWERHAVAAAVPPGSRVLVPACGGGREVLALLRLGYDAIGYESHPQLCAFGSAFLADCGYPGRVRSMARDRFPAGQRADAVLVGWGAMSLIVPRPRRVAFLHAAASAVGGGGHVILSCFVQPCHGRTLQATARIAAAIRRSRAKVRPELGDILAPNRVHVFTRAEVERELREAGLEPADYREVARADAVTQYVCAVGRAT